MRDKSKTVRLACLCAIALIALPAVAAAQVYVENNNLGVGIANPTQPLHVVSTTPGAKTMVQVTNNGAPFVNYTDTSLGISWALTPLTNGDFTVTRGGTGGPELLIQKNGLVRMGPGGSSRFTLTPGGNLFITGNLVTGGGGTCDPGPCDGLFAPDFEIESIEDHAEFMWTNSYLEGVGPTKKGEPINLTLKTTGLINELEKAHVYIEQLHKRLAEVEARLAGLEQR